MQALNLSKEAVEIGAAATRLRFGTARSRDNDGTGAVEKAEQTQPVRVHPSDSATPRAARGQRRASNTA